MVLAERVEDVYSEASSLGTGVDGIAFEAAFWKESFGGCSADRREEDMDRCSKEGLDECLLRCSNESRGDCLVLCSKEGRGEALGEPRCKSVLGLGEP